MNREKIKTITFFIMSVFIIFFLAHTFARESDVSFDDRLISTIFLTLSNDLESINFDLAFINEFTTASGRSLNETEPPVVIDIPEGFLGRVNPFSRNQGAPLTTRSAGSAVPETAPEEPTFDNLFNEAGQDSNEPEPVDTPSDSQVLNLTQ